MTSTLVSILDYEEEARKIVPRNALNYYQRGATDEVTLGLNRKSFNNIRILPRVLQSHSKRDMTVKLFGQQYSMPIGISPTAMQRMAHPDGEVASAKAAASRNTLFALSTLSTSSLEEVSEATPKVPKWFQLYIFKDRKITEKLVRRAEKAGYQAIALTVDAPTLGLRRASLREHFSLPPHLKLAHLESSFNGTRITEQYINEELLDQNLSWSDVKRLVKFTKLPVIAKGILTKADAMAAVEAGVHGIWVSNHGGRQLDSVPSTIEALPEIAAAVRDSTIVIFDGGVTAGTDVFKALALGADMVMFGKPTLWGLAVDGQQGVENVLDILRKELDFVMLLAGCNTIADITKDRVKHEKEFETL
ncbi:2-Hydroxyacid oxidase 1-like [Uranotaenia lowii]|uniref:2-Hydroxyacid oxidase 1-like n=1 Tax=Uranotaenia lowii TaxID=190385 RepID=UPI0024791BF2|nr:2-Hydroxyacid oxidase 1-like [Uranotaenia lowii]